MTLLSLPVRILSLLLLLGSLSAMQSQAAPVSDAWPRYITDSRGTHTLTQPAKRIVSTSVTLTGSLLAIGAPVIASGATIPGSKIADDQGFMRQWSSVAKQRQVKRLYIGEASAELVAAQRPDLILVSATGRDSARAIYPQLAAIAPVLIINYDDKSWQQLLTELGYITGHEPQAAERISTFNRRLKKVRDHLRLPPQPINALVYHRQVNTVNLWTRESAQGQFLQQLGFQLASLPANFSTTQSQGKRHDIVQLAGENMLLGLNGASLLLFANNDEDAQALLHNPLLAYLPAVAHQRVWALGNESFRLDYYSANLLLDRVEQLFTKQVGYKISR